MEKPEIELSRAQPMSGISNTTMKNGWNDWHQKPGLMGSSHTMASPGEQEIPPLSKILLHGNSW